MKMDTENLIFLIVNFLQLTHKENYYSALYKGFGSFQKQNKQKDVVLNVDNCVKKPVLKSVCLDT